MWTLNWELAIAREPAGNPRLGKLLTVCRRRQKKQAGTQAAPTRAPGGFSTSRGRRERLVRRLAEGDGTVGWGGNKRREVGRMCLLVTYLSRSERVPDGKSLSRSCAPSLACSLAWAYSLPRSPGRLVVGCGDGWNTTARLPKLVVVFSR